MHASATLAAQEALDQANRHIAELRFQADQERLAATGRVARNRWQAIASAVSSFRVAIRMVDDDRSLALPTLSGYPYRS